MQLTDVSPAAPPTAMRRGVAEHRSGPHHRAFTLIEILIVVTILGILATIVVPEMTNATHVAKETTLRDELRYLRTQIAVYKAQHNDIAAGAGSADFLQQMTLYTDEAGNTNAARTAVFRLGPYLSRMPANSLNAKDTLMISSSADLTGDVNDTTGWIYNPATQQIIANHSGADGNGTPYAKY